MNEKIKTVEGLRKGKDNLGNKIFDLINNYQEEFGVRVEDIMLHHHEGLDGFCITSVEVEVQI